MDDKKNMDVEWIKQSYRAQESLQESSEEDNRE